MELISLENLHFSPLHLAVVIESRFGLRRDLANMIRGLHLFEDVVEARSISDGHGIVDLRAVDCCLLGLGLNETNASGFALRGKNSLLSKDCGYIKLFTKADPLYDPQAFDMVMEMPANKAKLAEVIIRSVIQANSNSPWSGILLNSGYTEEEFFVMLNQEGQLKAANHIDELLIDLNEEPALPLPPPSNAMSAQRRSLSGLLKEITDERMAWLDENMLDEMANSITVELTQTLTIDAALVRQLVREWLNDRRTLSHQQSMKILERKLLKL